jgi:L-ribulose-5-phosphate 3-epimerase
MTQSKFSFILVQGRSLSQIKDSIQYFPVNWKEEFPIIESLGFDGIEWIFDKDSELTNPLLTKIGRNEMLNFSKKYNVKLENIVFDWFLVHPLLIDDEFNVEEKLKKFLFLLDASRQSGFKRIILPLMEKNSITDKSVQKNFIRIIQNNVLDYLEKWNIEIHLETSLSPSEEYNVLKKLNSKWVKSCFDMGNSASYGYDSEICIETISEYLGSVHIKDRKLHGSSVKLGEGNVNFNKVFESLNRINFCGPISFQIYRSRDSDDISLLKNNLTFINEIISKSVND